MSFRDAIRAALNRSVDTVLATTVLDMRQTRVAVVTRTWPGPQKSSALTPSDSLFYIPSGTGPAGFPRIRHVSAREVAGSGGTYELGDVIVGPIRPTFTDPLDNVVKGVSESQLNPLIAIQQEYIAQHAVEVIYRFSQEYPAESGINGDYTLIELKRDRVFRMMVVCGRRLQGDS